MASVAIVGGVETYLTRESGGYFPETWGWGTILFLLAAAAGLFVRRSVWRDRPSQLFGIALCALAAWTASSYLWSESPGRSPLESQRTLLYAAGVGAVVWLGRRASATWLIGVIFCVITGSCCYALAARTIPDHVGFAAATTAGRLGGSFAYAPALSIFAALGILLAFALLASARHAFARSVCAAATVPLGLTLYFTFSRGGWLALAVGCLGTVALSPSRRRTFSLALSVAVGPALAIWLASRSGPLTSWKDPIAASGAGHRLIASATMLSVVSAIGALLIDRSRSSVRVLQVAPSLATCVVLATGAIALTSFGSDSSVAPVAAGSAHAAATSRASAPTPAGRVFHAGSGNRPLYWRVAWTTFRAHPLAGAGAGTFALEWYRQRPVTESVANAHNLYLETLAELGLVGLALLGIALTMPLIAARRARRHPLVPGVFGAYLAYVVHAGVDWDWQLPAVTLAGLVPGAVLTVIGRVEGTEIVGRWLPRRVAALLLMAATAFACIGLVGSRAEAAALAAARHRDWAQTDVAARRAAAWAPWAAIPLYLEGAAAAGNGDIASARRYLSAAVRKDPENWQFWYWLSWYETGADRRAALTHARELNPLGGL